MIKLNVIFIGSFLYPKGYAATRRKQQFLDYLVWQGNKVRVLITLKWGKGQELNDDQGVHGCIPYELLGAGVKKNLLFPVTFLRYNFKSLYKLIKYKNKGVKNILVAFGFNFDTILPLIGAKLLGYKIVFDIVEDFTVKNNNDNFIKMITRYPFSTFNKWFKAVFSDAISVISTSLYNDYKERIDHSVLLKLIPISADNAIKSFNNRLTFKSDNYRFLYAGTYGEKEGLSYLFDAFKQLVQIHPEIRLVLTGKCPNRIKRELDAEYNITEKIEYTGWLDDREYFQKLNSANVMLMTRNNSPFANAGFPYKLGEYLASGKVVISTRVSDVDIYLTDKVNVILVEPEDTQALYDAMKFVIDNKDKAIEIGTKGRTISQEYFNPTINSKMFYDLLCQC